MSDEQQTQTQADDPSGPGWRDLESDEILQAGDVFKNGQRWERTGNPGLKARAGCGGTYRRRIEPWPEPEPETTTEQLVEIEGQGDTVQVREGRWRTRRGDIRNVTPTPEHDGRKERYPWWDAEWQGTWTANGRYCFYAEDPLDLVEYLGPIQQQSEPQSQPIQVREGRWKTRAGEIVSVSAMPTDHDDFSDAYAWWDGDVLTWANNGVFFSGYTTDKDLVEYLGPIEPKPEPQPEPEHLQAIISAQAETIARLQSEAHELNMEIGNLERQLQSRHDRIRDLETLNAGNGAAIDDYRAKVEKLQGLVDTARGQLEAAATERDELRAAIDASDKQLDQKDAQIRDLRIELGAAQQVPQPVGDDELDRIRDEATEQAGRQVVRWLRPLADALSKQPDERFCRFMALTLSVLPDVLPELLGYAAEDEAEANCEE